MSAVRAKLTGGTRTSVGAADEVILELLNDSSGLIGVYDLFLDEDPVVAMRSSYVAMKVAAQVPGTVEPFVNDLLRNLHRYTQQEVRWHIPQLLAHVKLTGAQKRKAYDVLMEWSETDKSRIVGYYSLQTAADFAMTDDTLLQDFIPRLKAAYKVGAKSIQNRCKKIAKQIGIDL
jgi:hypothetical protein